LTFSTPPSVLPPVAAGDDDVAGFVEEVVFVDPVGEVWVLLLQLVNVMAAIKKMQATSHLLNTIR
jgi:hypothetical protein